MIKRFYTAIQCLLLAVTLLFPLQIMAQEQVNIKLNVENPQVNAYMNNVKYRYNNSYDTYSIVSSYVVNSEPYKYDKGQEAVIYLPEGRTETWTLRYELDSVLLGEKTIYADDFKVSIGNLIPGKEYAYAIFDEKGDTVQYGDITTEGKVRMLCLPTIHNVRDLGGWTTSNFGTLRYGLLYRGSDAREGYYGTLVDEKDREEARRLGIGAELEFREVSAYGRPESSGFGEGVRYLLLDCKDGTDFYVTQTDNLTKAFRFVLANLKEGIPTYIHCAWGADRTGKFCALLEGLLDVRISNIYTDYELTSFVREDFKRLKRGLNSVFYYIEKRNPPSKDIHTLMTEYAIEELGLTEKELNDFYNIMVEPYKAPDAIVTPVYKKSSAIYTTDGIRHASMQRGLNIIVDEDGKVRKVMY